MAAVAGTLWADAAGRASPDSCLSRYSDGFRVQWDGYFIRDLVGDAGWFMVRRGSDNQGVCQALVRVYLSNPDDVSASRRQGGQGAQVVGRWVKSSEGRRGLPGYLSVGSVQIAEVRVPSTTQVAASIRRRITAIFKERLGGRASLAAALTLADRSEVEPTVREAFVRTGTAHLLSISGFHVGIVAGLLAMIMRITGLGPTPRSLGVALGLWLYVSLLGFPSAAVRAATMATAFLAGRLRQRPTLGLGGLGSAVLIMVILDPEVAAGVGFQLTVAGTLGILVLGTWVRSRLEDAGPESWKPLARIRIALASTVGAGVGATVFTAPLLALHFHEISLLSLPATFVVGPIVATAVPGIVLLVLLDLTGLPGGALVAWFVDGLLMGLEGIVMAMARMEWITVYVGPVEATAMAMGVFVGIGVLRTPWRVRPLVRVVTCLLVGWAGLLVGLSVRTLAGLGRIQITAIDVGQGDAVAVKTPRGRWILFDTGPKGLGGDTGATRVVPALRARGVRRLDLVILSHPDEDHAGGLASVLEALDVGLVVGPGMTIGQQGHLDGLKVAQLEGIPWRKVQGGDEWTIDGVRFSVLAPDSDLRADASPNDRSVVVLVTYGAFDALFMGDASSDIENGVVPRLCPLGICDGGVEVLKVGHHGSGTSSSAPFLEAIQPQFALISVGRRNRYGHPAKAVLARLEGWGTTVLRTDRRGTVDVFGDSDGRVRVLR